MGWSRRTQVIILGGFVGLVGAGVSAVYVLQPWRSCSVDDLASACPMLPEDTAVLMASLLVMLAGGAALSVSLLTPQRPNPPSRAHRVVVFGMVPLCFAMSAAGVIYLF